MSFVWNEQNLRSLGEGFLRRVVSNAGAGEKTTIQFGTMGDGHSPNYQVNQVLDIWGMEKKQTLIFNGRSHGIWEKEDKSFNQNNLSDPFLLSEIKGILNSLY